MMQISPPSPARFGPHGIFHAPSKVPTAFLALLLTLLIAAGCAEERTPPPEEMSAPENGRLMEAVHGSGADSYDEFVTAQGSLIYEDQTESWNNWSISAPEQTWIEPGKGKWIDFGAGANQAFSPAFERGTREIRLRFSLFLPENFPVFGHQSYITPRQLFGLSSTNTVLHPDDPFSRLDVQLNQASWYIVPRWRSQAGGEVVTGQVFEIPWALATGWNQIELVARVHEGSANDDLQLRVGSKRYLWKEVDLGVPDSFRYFHLGRWEPGAGDQLIAVRNLEIFDISQNRAMSDPPTGVDYASGGYRVSGGFWDGWMVRRHSDNCGSSPCIRFYDRDGHGAMRDHTRGVVWMGPGVETQGTVSMRVRFHGSQLSSTDHSRQLASITSRPLGFTPSEYGLESLTKITLDEPQPGSVRLMLINIVDGVRINDGRWPHRRVDVPFTSEQWGDLAVSWRMDGDRLAVTVNRQTETFDLLRGSEAPGVYLSLGNMDPISGVIDFDDIHINGEDPDPGPDPDPDPDPQPPPPDPDPDPDPGPDPDPDPDPQPPPPDPDPNPDPLPPPPAPPAGTVLYQENFEGSEPFRGWVGRNVRSNLRVIEQSGNKFGRLVYDPHSDWLVSFLPRRQGVMDLEVEYSVRLPVGFRYERDSNGQIIGGGKHFWQLTSINRYLGETVEADGRTRLDFGAATDFGNWNITAYRNTIGGGRPGEFAMWFDRENYFTPGRWHRLRCRVHINPQRGDDSGRLELWIDGDHKGTFRGEFNVVGSTGGIRVLGFGNLDNVAGAPWVEVDDIRVVAR